MMGVMAGITSCPRCHRGTEGSPCAHCGARFRATERTRGASRPGPRHVETPGGYVIEGPLATGGMGVVLRGRRRHDGRAVVCKAPRNSRPQARRRFTREARALASLDHPCIVCLLDIDCTPHGTPLLILSVAPGRPLREVLECRALEQAEFIAIAGSLASALDHCHRRRIVHRDVTPSNVMLGKDAVTLIDFGLAKVDVGRPHGGGPTHLTPQGAIMGTPPYAAPEQLSAPHNVGPAADIFSLGVLLRECGLRTVWTDRQRRYQWDALIDRMINVHSERRPGAAATLSWLAADRQRRTSVRQRRRRGRRLVGAALIAGVGAGLIASAPLWPGPRTRRLTGEITGPDEDLVVPLGYGRRARLHPEGNTRIRLPNTAWTDRPLRLVGNRSGRIHILLLDPDGRWQLRVERE